MHKVKTKFTALNEKEVQVSFCIPPGPWDNVIFPLDPHDGILSLSDIHIIPVVILIWGCVYRHKWAEKSDWIKTNYAGNKVLIEVYKEFYETRNH